MTFSSNNNTSGKIYNNNYTIVNKIYLLYYSNASPRTYTLDEHETSDSLIVWDLKNEKFLIKSDFERFNQYKSIAFCCVRTLY